MSVAVVERDEELVAEAAAGDKEAFGALYERYFQGLYDFAARTLHNRDLAGDVVQTTFTKAWEALQKGTYPQNVRAWLYTIARNDAIDQIRRAQRLVPDTVDDEGVSLIEASPDVGQSPEDLVRDQEMVNLVWQAASALNPRQYSLLDLHLRQQLSPDELAASLGLRRDNVYMMLSRLRDSLEESVTLLLLMQRGRRECPELNGLLAGHNFMELTRDTRRVVRRHLDTCTHCQELTRRYVSPSEIFAGLVILRSPFELQDSIWRQLQPHLEPLPVPVSPPPAPPAPAPPVIPPGGESFWLLQAPLLAKAGLIAASAVVSVALVVTVILRPTAGAAVVAVRDPDDARSSSHTIGQSSFLDVVEIQWTPLADAATYSVLWSPLPRDLPDAVADLPGSAGRVRSAPLAPGTWYFHMRTQGTRGGEWTSTVHLGPFIIVARPEPTAAAPRLAPTPIPQVLVPDEPRETETSEPAGALDAEAELAASTDLNRSIADEDADASAATSPLAVAPTATPTTLLPTATLTPGGTPERSVQAPLPQPTDASTPSPLPRVPPTPMVVASPPGGVAPSPFATPVSTQAPFETPVRPTAGPTDEPALPTSTVPAETPAATAVPSPVSFETPADAGAPTAAPFFVAGTPTSAPPPPRSAAGSLPTSAPSRTAVPAQSNEPDGSPPTSTPHPTSMIRTSVPMLAASPTRTVTRSPVASSSRTAEPTVSTCSPMVLITLQATPQAERVTVTWAMTGGCAPYSGTITATGQGYSNTQTISSAASSINDSPPRCIGLVSYRLQMRDSAGNEVSGIVGANVNRDCP